MPDTAIVEAYESLSDSYRFHTTPFVIPKPLPGTKAVPARTGVTSIRPVFPWTGEE